MANNREVKDVIDDAIKENKKEAFIALMLAGIFIVGGLVGLARGILCQEIIGYVYSVVDLVLAVLFLRVTYLISKENFKLRVLEIPLGKADGAREALEILRSILL